MATPDASTEITPLELVRALERGEALQLVDVRLPERVRAGRIDLLPPERFHNLLNSRLLPLTDLAATGLEPALPAVTVCGHGNSSREAAAHLRALGLEAVSLRGGMAAWMDALVERPLAPPPGLDHLLQFDRIGKGSLAYLLAGGGEALLVDPPRRAGAMLEAAARVGARVVGVAETHVHADFVGGAAALAASLGVPHHLHPADNAYAFDGTPGRLAIAPLADGAGIRVGRATVVAHHNPGHTLGSVSLALGDALVLSGDFVFVDSLGRPDLAGRAREWAALLWESLERARRTWAPDALVLPGHYAGERERRPDRVVAASFRALLATNPALRPGGRDAFLAWATTPAPVPANYPVLKAVNVGLRQVGDAEAEELDVGRNECAVARPVA
ncbi:MAG TPA: MBL fold metallo-hydrolase [Candidatus Eisenbacteria bacterium]|nr:MBL fold metallo-hydrolase [Candidatus Eisenbacteria bacterium]